MGGSAWFLGHADPFLSPKRPDQRINECPVIRKKTGLPRCENRSCSVAVKIAVIPEKRGNSALIS